MGKLWENHGKPWNKYETNDKKLENPLSMDVLMEKNIELNRSKWLIFQHVMFD